jgi:hypothetical protein
MAHYQNRLHTTGGSSIWATGQIQLRFPIARALELLFIAKK